MENTKSNSDSEDENATPDTDPKEKVKKAIETNELASTSAASSSKKKKKNVENAEEVCAICLSDMYRTIGSPDMCDHSFCLECILEWAKTNNTCPKDRIPFLQVFSRRRVGGKIIKTIPITEVKPDDIPDDEDNTFCEVCGLSDREDSMLLCDQCDHGYHLDCLRPRLTSVPFAEWFCDVCEANFAEERARALEAEVPSLITGGSTRSGRFRIRSPRAVPRTSGAVRVRARIARARNDRHNTATYNSDDHPSMSDVSEVEAGPSTSGIARRRVVKKRRKPTKRRVVRRKTTKKRKVQKRKTTKTIAKSSMKTIAKPRKKRKTKVTKRKRKTKGKVRRSAKRTSRRRVLPKRLRKNCAASTVKSRIAETLGITPNDHPWQLSLPAMKKATDSLSSSVQNLRIQKFRAGVPSLDLLGSSNEFDFIPEGDSDDGQVGEGVFALGRRSSLVGTGTVMARRKASAILRAAPTRQRRPITAHPTTSFGASSTPLDILGSLIEDQDNLLNSRLLKQRFGVKIDPIRAKGQMKECGNGESGSSPEGRPEPQQQTRSNSRGAVSEGRRSTPAEPHMTAAGDPTGSEAYSSYLRERRLSGPSDYYNPERPTPDEPKKKKNPKDKHEEEVDLYSDVEPEAWDDWDSAPSPGSVENKSHPDKEELDDDPSTDDDLVIDDTVSAEVNRNSVASNGYHESSALARMREYDGLEEVSDTEVQDLDKSPNSSISLSDSNMEDVEIINDPVERIEIPSSPVSPSNVGMGLDGLEVETISDSEETCFEDENIEEGEILCEIPSKLPLVRPRVNMQFKKPLEMLSSSKEFDGDYEEGEIVDENATANAKRDKREKAKEEVDKVVNQPLDEASEEEPTNNGLSLEVPAVVDEAVVATTEEIAASPKKVTQVATESDRQEETKDSHKDKKQDISFKKVSKNTKVRNYRDNEKDTHAKRKEFKEKDSKTSKERTKRKYSPDRNEKEHNKRRKGRTKDRDRERDRDKMREPKRKEIERYNVRQMINKKEEERKKKDEFGRDVSLRDYRSRSKSARRRGSRPGRKSRSRSRHGRRSSSRKARRRKRSYSSSSSSSSSSSGSSSSFTTSSSSSSRSSSSSPPRKRDRRNHESKPSKKQADKRKDSAKPKEKLKEKSKAALITPTKKDNRKEKISDSEDLKVDKIKKKKRREKSPLQSKAVFQSGGSIMVSVNFSRNQAKENKEKKKKDKDGKMELNSKTKPPADTSGRNTFSWAASGGDSPTGKRTPLQDEPMWSPENATQQNKGVSPDTRDMDIIMVTPPPQEPIMISDSEDEGITRLPPDLGAKPVSPQMRNQGPKTPPDPGVKFTLSTKQNLKSITNPLLGDDEQRKSNVPIRGPNTPPGPPPESDESGGRVKSPRMPHSRGGTPLNSSPEPDVYDPFEPTKSPSPQISPPARELSKESIEITDSPVKEASPVYPSNTSHSTPPPPLPSEPPEPEEKPPEPQKPLVEEPRPVQTVIPLINVSTAPSTVVGTIAHPPTCIPALFPSSSLPLTQNATIMAQPIGPMQQIFAGLPPNVANILYPAALAAVRGAASNILRPPIVQSILTPDLSRPPPGLLQPPPALTLVHNNSNAAGGPKFAGDKSRPNQNGKTFHGDFADLDIGSPTSPDSSDASDIFEPPSPHRHDKISPRKQRSTVTLSLKKPSDRFDVLFGSGGHGRPQKSKQVASNKTPTKCSGKLAAELDEEIPNSAVDLQVKERFLKKIQRQERVVEEVKLCLKPFYNKKSITKDEYKDIMKKCVQKVCHNKSGEINPIKIRSLVEGYIKKFKYYRKKFGGPPGSGAPPGVSDPPAPGFAISKSHSVKVKP